PRVGDECGGGWGCGRLTRPAHPPLGSQAGGLPRVTRLTSMAIGLDGLLRSRELLDQATVARLGRVSRARLTQIMNLLFLAPDIQEQLLFLPPIIGGRTLVLLPHLQPIAAQPNWSPQRQQSAATYTAPPPQ